jgi:hypothetical protein
MQSEGIAQLTGCSATSAYPAIPSDMLSTSSEVQPSEFVVMGRPAHSTDDPIQQQQWQATVQQAAQAGWRVDAQRGQPVSIVVTYYYDDKLNRPVDRLSNKHLIRSLKAALRHFLDQDKIQGINFVAQRRNLNRSFRIKGLSGVLAAGLCSGGEFLHVRILD